MPTLVHFIWTQRRNRLYLWSALGSSLALVVLFFTLRLFFRLCNLTSNILFIFFFVNPLLLYTANLIMADAIFNGLSILWLVQLLWIIYRPKPYMIFTHALSFARWFLWPNCKRNAPPPREIYMTITPFFLRPDELGPEATRWFGLTTLMVKPAYINLRLQISSFYPFLLGLIHLCFVLSLLGFSLNKGWQRIGKPYNYCILTVLFLWLCDLGFSLTAAAIVMRYQIFPVVLEFSFSLFFLEYVYRHADKPLYLPFQKPS